MNREIVKNTPFESFPNYTDEMYIGEIPCGKGGQYTQNFKDTIVADRWSYQYGTGESIDDDVLTAVIEINKNDSVFLYGKTIRINHITQQATYFWCNDNSFSYGEGGLLGTRLPLEFDRAMTIINKLDRCKFEKMVKNKIMELIE